METNNKLIRRNIQIYLLKIVTDSRRYLVDGVIHLVDMPRLHFNLIVLLFLYFVKNYSLGDIELH